MKRSEPAMAGGPPAANARTRPLDSGMTRLGMSPVATDPVDGCPGGYQMTLDNVLAQYQVEIHRFAAHLTRKRTTADKLYQQTLREASRAVDRSDGTANPRIWLYTIATNAFLSDWHTGDCEDPFAEERTAELPGVPQEHVARLATCDLLREVEDVIAAVPRKQWAALVQRRYHGLSYAEIADILCCSEAAARSSVYEVLRTLRAHLGDRL
jgi:RNA polymerase sigma-70 factor (ECF subfamily)